MTVMAEIQDENISDQILLLMGFQVSNFDSKSILITQSQTGLSNYEQLIGFDNKADDDNDILNTPYKLNIELDVEIQNQINFKAEAKNKNVFIKHDKINEIYINKNNSYNSPLSETEFALTNNNVYDWIEEMIIQIDNPEINENVLLNIDSISATMLGGGSIDKHNVWSNSEKITETYSPTFFISYHSSILIDSQTYSNISKLNSEIAKLFSFKLTSESIPSSPDYIESSTKKLGEHFFLSKFYISDNSNNSSYNDEIEEVVAKLAWDTLYQNIDNSYFLSKVNDEYSDNSTYISKIFKYNTSANIENYFFIGYYILIFFIIIFILISLLLIFLYLRNIRIKEKKYE